jgi:hypothetical protein
MIGPLSLEGARFYAEERPDVASGIERVVAAGIAVYIERGRTTLIKQPEQNLAAQQGETR